MKRYYIFGIVVFLLLLLCSMNVSAKTIERIVETDIVTFIDNSPIKSYNYKGYTYVIAEDLRNYGFDVEWNPAQRTLSIARNKYVYAPYVNDFINKKKQVPTYKTLYNVYETNIKVYLNGREITAYNIGGQTIINVDYLQEFGYCTYDNEQRRYDVDILSKEIQDCEERQSQSDGDEYGNGAMVYIEKGLFDGDELIYGMKSHEIVTRFGKNISSEYGDFKNKKFLWYRSSYQYDGDRYAFHTPDTITYCIASESFEYGLFKNCITPTADTGKEYRYLPDTGELYLIRQIENNRYLNGETTFDSDGNIVSIVKNDSFFGQLFKNGILIYDGEIKLDKFKFYHGNRLSGKLVNVIVLYAPGYTDSDGVIYYYEKLSDDYGFEHNSIYYRGNVVNGVTHGFGTMYRFGRCFFENSNLDYTVYIEDGTEIFSKQKCNVMYIGNFQDGLMHGEGRMYDYGQIEVEGTWKKGKKNGHFREFDSTSNDKGYMSFKGNYVDDCRTGFGIEYEQRGFAYYEGLYERFVGEWKDNNWYYGKWFALNYDKETNTHVPYLNYEGEVRYDEPQFGTNYKYYNESTSQFEVKTGYFLGWRYLGEKIAVQTSGKQIAYIDPYGWELIGEIFIYDSEKDLNYKVLKREDIPSQYTPKEVYWLDERYLIAIVGFAYGTVEVGGDVYIIDTVTSKCGVYYKNEPRFAITDIYAIGDKFVFLTEEYSETESKYLPVKDKIVPQSEVFNFARQLSE